MNTPEDQCLQSLLVFVRALRREASLPATLGQLELEMRFGTLQANGHFVAGVPLQQYEEVARQLQKFGGWEAVTNDGEAVIYHYLLPGSREPLRTTTVADHPSGHLVRHETKQRLLGQKFGHTPRDLRQRGFDWRLSLSRERRVPAESIPGLLNPEHVRIMQRNSYQRGRWRYDLSIVWSGRTHDEAERCQTVTGVTQFELEVECCDLAGLLALSDRKVAQDIMFKVADLHRLADTVTRSFIPLS